MNVSFSVNERRPEHLTLLIDGEPWHVVHPSIIGYKPKFSGENLQECQEKFDLLEYKGAKRFVLKRLSLKSYYSGELITALKERLVSSSTIDAVIADFTRLGYINDQEWVVSAVRRLQCQKCGPKAIAMKLYAKGVAKEAVRTAIDACCDDASQQMNIHRLLASRYRSRDLSVPKEKQKVAAALMRKGYALNQIFEVMRQVSRLTYDRM